MTVPALSVADPAALRALVDGHRSGRAPLGGALDLYYALERSSSLLEFHTMLRDGPRNRTRDGLQQSYGDHNRLLMLALDRLLAGDVDWLASRVPEGVAVSADSLAACAATAAALSLTPDEELALWLGAALHDCGMLGGRGAHVDVEDGVVLARPVLDECCPEATRDLAAFVLRHHDYVKDAFLGEAPVGPLLADLAALDPAQRPLALAALGLIQVAGSSSLGEGRLTAFRLGVCSSCAEGNALAGSSPADRLARLLAPSPDVHGEAAGSPDPDAAWDRTDALAPVDRAALDALLESVFVHGWHGFVGDAGPEPRLVALVALARLAADTGAEHLVIDAALRAPTADRLPDRSPAFLPARLPARPATDRTVALSGSVVVTVGPGADGN